MKDIELPPLSKFDHPEPRTMQWSDLELYAIKSYARTAVEADRAQRVPDIDYEALIHAGWKNHKYAQGTRGCIAFKHGAEWFRYVLLASTPAPAQQEPSEAEMVCAEAYQVVGCLLSDLGLFETEAARKILDNLSEARMVHQDVLPWKPAAQHQEPPQQERKPMTDEQDRALCEAFCNAASDEYFKARPQLDSDVNRRIFYAGHRKAWLEWQTAHGIKE